MKTSTTPAKGTLYRTAKTKVSAVGIKEGDFVAIRHYYTAGEKLYYMVVNRTDESDTDTGIVLPDHHLERFCL